MWPIDSAPAILFTSDYDSFLSAVDAFPRHKPLGTEFS